LVKIVKGKLLVGPILVLIGGAMLIIACIIGYTRPEFAPALAAVPIINLSFILPLILGILSIFGAILALIGKTYINYIIIIIGLVGTIGMITPIAFYNLLYTLVVPLAFIDPVLVLIGGILGVVIKE